MFLDGNVSNISAEHIQKWVNLVCELKPNEVQIYTIERKTPTDKVKPVPKETLHHIKNLLIDRNISAKVY